jgi:hypothetical protein
MFFNSFYIFSQTRVSLGLIGHPTFLTNFEGIAPGNLKTRSIVPTASYSANIERQVSPKFSLGIGYFMESQRTTYKIYGEYNPPKYYNNMYSNSGSSTRNNISINGKYFPLKFNKWKILAAINFTWQHPFDSFIFVGSGFRDDKFLGNYDQYEMERIWTKHPKSSNLTLQMGIGYNLLNIKKVFIDLDLIGSYCPPSYNQQVNIYKNNELYQFSNTINNSFIGLRLSLGYQKAYPY